jgi:flagellar hook-associated protein 1 FlgK
MPSFFDLNIAVSALRAQQYALSVTSHNIANANTEGYRRQEPVFLAGSPLMGAASSLGMGIPLLGTGVMVDTVRRMQNTYMDAQIRLQNQSFGMWSSRNEALRQVESMLAEPGELGLSQVMDRFWNSWHDLASEPESTAARISVLEAGAGLADRIRGLYRDLRGLQLQADQTIAAKAGEINKIAAEIAGLNAQITESLAMGAQPNDLLDRRDLLVEQLSQMARVEAHGFAGDMIISIGGQVLVQGNYAAEIGVTAGASGWSELNWTGTGTPVLIAGGELKGLIEVRDSTIEGYMQSLNAITQAIVSRVNELHVSGFDLSGNAGIDFFVPGSDASTIAMNPVLLGSPSRISISLNGAPGDNSLADAIAGIREEALVGGKTIGEAYVGLASEIGSQTREAGARTNVHELSLRQLRTQRDAISGVSLDEEMVNMVKFQQAYNAAARVLTVVDEMIDTLINRTGVGGR